MDKGYSGLNPYKANNITSLKKNSNVIDLAINKPEVETMRIKENVVIVKVENIVSENVEKAIKGHPFAHPKYSPIKVPYNATVKKKSKNGYEQVKYIWRSGDYKYESRWHTSTPGAPNKKQSWVITKTKRGSGSTQPITMVRSGKKWVSWDTWHAAIVARRNGIATKAQIKLLDKGHFTRKRGKK